MLFIVKDLLKNKSRMDNNTFKVFVDACMIEVNKKGNTPTSHFNKLYDRLMRIETGIDGTRSLIDTPPEWCEEKIKENKEYAKFSDTDLSIFDMKYAILFRDSVEGDSDEINLDDDETLFPSFPESSSSKRKKSKNVSNRRSTKSKTSIYEEKVDALLDAISTKSTQTFPQNNPSLTIADFMTVVIKFPGFVEARFPSVFTSIACLHQKNKTMKFLCFQLVMMQRCSFLTVDIMMDSDDSYSYDDNEECWVEEDREFEMLHGLALKGIIIACNIHRTGHLFINEVLNGHPRWCYEMFRLYVPVFRQLCTDLATNYGLQQTRNIYIEESVGIFLMTLAHGCSNRFVQEFFNHSGETTHRHFDRVLVAILKMSADIIRPVANYNDEVLEYILNNPRYYPMFKDCIGAIDGTHIRASGTAHDTRIFNEALQRPDIHFPFPTGGTHIRYHLPDFRHGHTVAMSEPHGQKEKFNYYHSSLRNIIEQNFEVRKARWTLLRDMHVNYKYEHQMSILIASMAIHNYIRKTGRLDETFNRAQRESYIPTHNRISSEGDEEGPSTHRTSNDNSYMATIRDIIAQDIMEFQR
uniref:DUF8040 domain-containing protein n=1 Tax=Lactuca sativa TaxID=4236 RepID=A0A9R1VV33_LACSA|nr:hypothetical protein LSAT_V11C400193170 [Lactuca sativa]